MAETGIVRYLPTPSDRMGLLWTLLTIKDGVILELGPSGTTHYLSLIHIFLYRKNQQDPKIVLPKSKKKS